MVDEGVVRTVQATHDSSIHGLLVGDELGGKLALLLASGGAQGKKKRPALFACGPQSPTTTFARRNRQSPGGITALR